MHVPLLVYWPHKQLLFIVSGSPASCEMSMASNCRTLMRKRSASLNTFILYTKSACFQQPVHFLPNGPSYSVPTWKAHKHSISVAYISRPTYLLSRVYGCVTNNNGYWIGWFDLLTGSLAIFLTHAQIQELTINLQPNPSSSLHSRSLSFYDFLQLNYADSSRHGPRTENTVRLLRACLLGFAPDHYPARPLARWLLPRNGLGANYIENTAPILFAACLFERVYLATGFSDSTA
jgi:hypothetical protein